MWVTVKEEAKLLNSICLKVKQTGKITKDQNQLLLKIFGKRFQSAIKAVEETAVKKYIFYPSRSVIWIVVGKERDYQVLPSVNYCSCDDFYYRVLRGDTSLCYHVMAQRLAEALGRFDVVEDSDEMYEHLMREWRFIKENMAK